MTTEKILKLIVDKKVNMLIIDQFTDVKKYNLYISVYETQKDRRLTKREFGWLKNLLAKKGL